MEFRKETALHQSYQLPIYQSQSCLTLRYSSFAPRMRLSSSISRRSLWRSCSTAIIEHSSRMRSRAASLIMMLNHRASMLPRRTADSAKLTASRPKILKHLGDSCRKVHPRPVWKNLHRVRRRSGVYSYDSTDSRVRRGRRKPANCGQNDRH